MKLSSKWESIAGPMWTFFMVSILLSLPSFRKYQLATDSTEDVYPDDTEAGKEEYTDEEKELSEENDSYDESESPDEPSSNVSHAVTPILKSGTNRTLDDSFSQEEMKQNLNMLKNNWPIEKFILPKEIDCSKGNSNCEDCSKISPHCHYNGRAKKCFYSNYTHHNVIYECATRWYPVESFGNFYIAISFVLLISLGFGIYFVCLYYMKFLVVVAIPRVDVDRLRQQVQMVRERRNK